MENERVINVGADLLFNHLKDSVMGTGALQQKNGQHKAICVELFLKALI